MAFNRRELLVGGGTAAALGTGALASPASAQGQQLPREWHREAAVVVIGSGATGLPAAIVAKEAGSSVILVEAQPHVGGHARVSGGNMPLGGGTSVQKRYGIQDSPDLVFDDLTDWSVVQPNGFPDYRYNDREIIRAFADNCTATFEFLRVRTSAVRPSSRDSDFRVVYSSHDPTRYSIVVCPTCGYAAYFDDFDTLDEDERALIAGSRAERDALGPRSFRKILAARSKQHRPRRANNQRGLARTQSGPHAHGHVTALRAHARYEYRHIRAHDSAHLSQLVRIRCAHHQRAVAAHIPRSSHLPRHVLIQRLTIHFQILKLTRSRI